MDVLAWILSIVLALAFLAAGGMKLATPKAKLQENPQMGWTEGFSEPQIKGLAAAEVLGALGLVLPWALDIVRVLTPLAAVGLAVVMLGALITHAKRGELARMAPINGGLLLVALVVAVLRFTQL